MDILKYKSYEGSAELDMVRGVCRGKVLFITDLVTYEAAFPKELQKEFEAAVNDYIETCELVGKEPSQPFKGSFNVRIEPALHRAAAIRALTENTSLNAVVGRALDQFLNVHTEVNHNVRITLVAKDSDMATFKAVAAGKPQWETRNVH